MDTTKLVEIFTQIIGRLATPQTKEKIDKYIEKIVINLLKIINQSILWLNLKEGTQI